MSRHAKEGWNGLQESANDVGAHSYGTLQEIGIIRNTMESALASPFLFISWRRINFST